MAIDMHAHWGPENLMEILRGRDDAPFLRPRERGGEILETGRGPMIIDKNFSSLEERVARMDTIGFNRVVWSITGSLIDSLIKLPGNESLPLCRIYNDGASAAHVRWPDRFLGLAMLPHADIDLAAEELERAIELPGIIGAIIPGNGFRDIERAERFRPLFEIGQRHGLHFLVHNARLHEDFENVYTAPDNAGVRRNTLEMQANLSSAMITFCLTDFLEPYPDVTVQVHNLGGNLPYEIERMDHLSQFRYPEDPLPSTRFKRVMLDCNSFGPHGIELACSLYGADRIMIGTDGTEFGMRWTLDAISKARIDEADKQKILDGNAAALIAKANTKGRAARNAAE